MAPTYNLFPVPAYKVSKAAQNMLTVQYAQSFADQGFTFVTVSPGVSHPHSNLMPERSLTKEQWVKTDLGGPGADLTADQSANGILEILFRITKEDNGKFFNIRVDGWEKAEGLNRYDGEEAPW